MVQGLLSAIVLTYKHGDYLKETIISIFKQEYPAIEIIIAEDGNRDFNRDEIEKFILLNKKDNIVNVQFLVNRENKGTVANLNNAINHSNGEYIKIIAGDDTYPGNTVFMSQVQYLIHNSSDFVVGNIVECDANMTPLKVNGFSFDNKIELLNKDKNILLNYFCKKDSTLLATQSICFTRKFFDVNGLYDERLKLIEDLPMAVKIISRYKINYQDIEVVNHRGEVGVSANNVAFDKKKILYYKDLEKYFTEILTPYSKEIGTNYIKMRINICRFRIAYSMLDKNEYTKKLVLVIRYSFSLLKYIITNAESAKGYLKNVGKE